MNTRAFRAMNTDWWIGTPHAVDLAPLEAQVHEAERRYSRFLDDSLLTRLNRERAVVDRDLAALLREAAHLSATTRGAFDVRVGAAMVASGYDRSFDLLPPHTAGLLTFAPPVTRLAVLIEGDSVQLEGDGTVDLGGIAKGWTVDRVMEALVAAGCRDALVDGGGDIRAIGVDERGECWRVGVGEGLAIDLRDGAVCTSSTRRRRWRRAGEDAHHIIDPGTGAPSRGAIAEAVVVAATTTLADALATTVIANPEAGLAAVGALGAAALVLIDGRWEMTAGMDAWLS